MEKAARRSAVLRLECPKYPQRGPAILHGIDLSVFPGERLAVVGASGAGKSTLLGLLRALRPREVAWCPQHPALVETLSVFHNIYMGRLERYSLWKNLRNLVMPEAAELEAVGRIAEQLGIRTLLHRSPDRISGGQQQRTALGRALYQERPLFLGDEPLSSVDELQAHKLLEGVLQAHQTSVVALHDRRLALDHFDRVLGLRHGRLVLDAPAAELALPDLDGVYP